MVRHTTFRKPKSRTIQNRPNTSYTKFHDFLIHSAHLVDHQYQPKSKLERAIHKDRNRLLAWREHAPARLHITQPQGPFHRSRILTRGGIFSALIFRAITFGAPVLDSHDGYFPDITAWNDFHDPSKPASHYCRVTVYGNGVHRGTKNVPQLWEASTVLLYKLQTSPGPSFKEVWHHVVHARAKDGRMMYPTIGKLVGYLLCVDLVYAGVLKGPSLSDHGYIVADVSRGARDGMVRLMLIQAGSSRKEVSAAFQSLCKYLFRQFRTHHLSYCFNGFIVENGLCKYKRLVRK